MAMASKSASFSVKAALCFGLGWLATGAQAATTTIGSSSQTSTSSAAAVTHTIAVAATGHTFEPNQVTANVNDTILFEFYQGNHSVARAEYKSPCIPYENLGKGRVGFWSGFKPVEGIPAENGPRFSFTVNSTEPIFYYCSADGSCLPNGMIGVINANATQTLDVQREFIKNSTYQLSPGEAPPSESTATSTPSTSSPTSTPSSTTTPDHPHSSPLSKGAIAGIAVGGVAVIALAALAFYLCGRNRTLASVVRYSQPPQPKHASSVPSPMAFAPVSPQPNEPYAPSYSDNLSPKPSLVAHPSPNMNYHDSWQSQQGHTGPVSPGFSAPYQGQLSPGQAPWSPGGFAPQQGQYSAVPQQQGPYHQEMATGQEHNMTPSASPGYVQQTQQHELP